MQPADDFFQTPQPAPARRPSPDHPYLARALATLDWDDPHSVARCRAAALRHTEGLQGWGIGAGLALRLLRAAAAIWLPERTTPAQRRELEQRLRFWVGTVYGVRWRAAPVADRPAGEASSDGAPGTLRDASDPPLRAD